MEQMVRFLNAIYPLSDTLKDYLRQNLKSKRLQKRDYLLRAGHTCRHIYFVEQGLLRCYYLKGDQEVSSWFMQEGDMAVSLVSFFEQIPSNEYIQALEDCLLYYLEYSELQDIYKRFPEFNFIGRSILQKYYKQSEQRLFAMRLQQATERYDILMRQAPELILRVPAKYLASYLGITEVRLSMIKSRKVIS